MSTEIWPASYGRRVLQSVDSTLNEAARIAPSLSGPEWILAHEQTAARGRRGRAWRNPKGNFAATLVLRPDGPPQAAALRSFVAALALYDAIASLSGRATGLALKWPNDVLLNGGKLCGVLLESVGAGTGVQHLFVGIGINLIEAPSMEQVETQALRPVSLLSETGVSVDPETMLDHLAAAYARWETQFTTYGFAPIRTEWLSRAARLGETIRARTASADVQGVFETVDEDGNLVLKTARGSVAIPAADVFF